MFLLPSSLLQSRYPLHDSAMERKVAVPMVHIYGDRDHIKKVGALLAAIETFGSNLMSFGLLSSNAIMPSKTHLLSHFAEVA